jgi:hypothetical protein
MAWGSCAPVDRGDEGTGRADNIIDGVTPRAIPEANVVRRKSRRLFSDDILLIARGLKIIRFVILIAGAAQSL